MRISPHKIKSPAAGYPRAILLMCLAVFFLMSFSVCGMALEAEHDCSGEDCLLCACLHQFENGARQMFLDNGWFVLFILLMAFIVKVIIREVPLTQTTLITQKVRLDN